MVDLTSNHPPPQMVEPHHWKTYQVYLAEPLWQNMDYYTKTSRKCIVLKWTGTRDYNCLKVVWLDKA